MCNSRCADTLVQILLRITDDEWSKYFSVILHDKREECKINRRTFSMTMSQFDFFLIA